MKNLAGLMKQASQMQARMEEVQNTLNNITVEGVSGAGLVRITLNGKGEMRGIALDPQLLNPGEGEVLQDLILAAFADAKGKVEAANAEEMRKVTGGLDLPAGLKLPF